MPQGDNVMVILTLSLSEGEESLPNVVILRELKRPKNLLLFHIQRVMKVPHGIETKKMKEKEAILLLTALN
jgi:hypothetical protein